MDVWAYDPFLKKEDIQASGAKPVDSVAELFKANFVSLHIPCTPETKNSITKEFLLSMPKNGVLVNTARAEVVDEDGLLAALEERNDLRYVADVQPTNLEALNKSGKKMAFVTAKKQGAATTEANNNAGIAAAKQIVDYFEKGETKFQVNKPGQTW